MHATLCFQILQPISDIEEIEIKTEDLSAIDDEVIVIDLDEACDISHSAGDILELMSPLSPISSVVSDETVIEHPLQD